MLPLLVGHDVVELRRFGTLLNRQLPADVSA